MSNRGRWKDVERRVATELNRVLSDVGEFTPVERIPLLGRAGPDLTVNETNLVVNVKSRLKIPVGCFPKAGEMLEFAPKSADGLVCFRLEELSRIDRLFNYMPTKPSKQIIDWWQWMDKWTKEFQPAGITCIVIHRPRMPIGHAGVVLQTKDLRRLSCQIQQIQSN